MERVLFTKNLPLLVVGDGVLLDGEVKSYLEALSAVNRNNGNQVKKWR